MGRATEPVVEHAHSDARTRRRLGWRRIAAGCVIMTLVVVAAPRRWLRLQDYRMRRHTEATHMVQSIRVAEEILHAETGRYANISRALAANARTNHFALYPQAPREPGEHPVPWGSECPPSACLTSWSILPIEVDGPVRFGYSVIAGRAGERPEAVVSIDGTPVSWPVPAEDWYIVSAVGDPNGDGTFTTVVVTSFDDAMRIDTPSELGRLWAWVPWSRR